MAIFLLLFAIFAFISPTLKGQQVMQSQHSTGIDSQQCHPQLSCVTAIKGMNR